MYILTLLDVFCFTGDVDYFVNFKTLETLCENINQNQYTYKGTVDCWAIAYKTWLSMADTTITVGKLNSGESQYSNVPLNVFELFVKGLIMLEFCYLQCLHRLWNLSHIY